MEELYKFIEKKNLNSNEKIIEFCTKNNIKNVIETSMEAFTLSIFNKFEDTHGSLFNFSASTTLSGTNYPCASIPCRIKQVANLAKFTSFYSNYTTIYNPFDFIYSFLDPNNNSNITNIQLGNEALNAFLITYEFKPLIERGLIRFSRTVYSVCINCKKERDKNFKLINKNLDNIAVKKLIPLLENNIKIVYEKNSFHISGIKPFIGDDMYIHNKKFS